MKIVVMNASSTINTKGIVLLQTIEMNSILFNSSFITLYSNPLTAIASGVDNVTITLQNNVPNTDISVYQFTNNFTSECFLNDFETVTNFTCLDSGYGLEHVCRGEAEILTSFCPIPGVTCGSLNFASNSLNEDRSVCEMIDFTTNSVTCNCVINKPSAVISEDRRRRRLVSEDSAIKKSGVLNLATMAVYVFDDFGTTFTATSSMTSPKALQRVLVVILMFSSLWVGGIVVLFFISWRQRQANTSNKNKVLHQAPDLTDKTSSTSSEQVYKVMYEYIQSVFPAVFNPTSSFDRLKRELT
jgi:hypothetical protein